MPSIYMTNCPTCGCGGSGEYFVANVEWGVCAVPEQHTGYNVMKNLSDVVDYKVKDTATIILQYESSVDRFVDTSSPVGMQVKPGQPNMLLNIGAITGACVPDSVQFLLDELLPTGYCSDPQYPVTWNYNFTWPSGNVGWDYMCGSPSSCCNGSQPQSINLRATTVNAPSTSGDSVNFVRYQAPSNVSKSGVYGWLACTADAINARNYCNVPLTLSPTTLGPCSDVAYSENGWFFDAYLYFYVKGTLTYYNV